MFRASVMKVTIYYVESQHHRSWWIQFRETAVFPDSQYVKTLSFLRLYHEGHRSLFSVELGRMQAVWLTGYLKVLSCEPTSVKDSNI